jgi:hypothetical protein
MSNFETDYRYFNSCISAGIYRYLFVADIMRMFPKCNRTSNYLNGKGNAASVLERIFW